MNASTDINVEKNKIKIKTISWQITLWEVIKR